MARAAVGRTFGPWPTAGSHRRATWGPIRNRPGRASGSTADNYGARWRPTRLTAWMIETDAVRLVLVDDHEVVRAGLRHVLEAQPGWTVEAEAGDIDRALRATLGHKPDVLILDLNLGGVSALEYIPALLERSPQTRIVV